ncbi:QRFP-like peptide receptor [Haliotis cracherodii]|uniref:QRFP-like peptide receptor n=1 Tax=Haliotis rufescens TaxID=6454 RepID=UPI001EB0A78F|nr:QRFP-like peptide receptor [Haliotis rufescens]
MDQQQEYNSYKHLLESKNFTAFLGYPYNFTGAEDILHDFEHSYYTRMTYRTVILLSLYAPIFLVGLVGNILIICTVASDKNVRKAKNYYLLNLAAADLMVTLFCMPMAITTIIYRLWIYGEFLCKAIVFVQGIAVANSIFTLTAMSIDRYISIQHPVTAHRVTSPGQALIIILVIWIVSGIFMGPLLYIRKIDTLEMPQLTVMQFCIEDWPQDYDRQAFGVFLLFMIYIIPGGTLAICYAHVGKTLCSDDMCRESSDSSTKRLFSRKRAARMLIILVVIFMICWLPYNITSLSVDIAEESEPVRLLPFALWLGHAHSAVNPVMYWLLNRRFRDKVRSMMKYIRRSNMFLSSPTPDYV